MNLKVGDTASLLREIADEDIVSCPTQATSNLFISNFSHSEAVSPTFRFMVLAADLRG